MIDWMKLLMYKGLTQGIVILGALRNRLEKRMKIVVRKDRTFVAGVSCTIECCDCGLKHLNWVPKDGNAQLAQPLRPNGYDYGGRYGAGQSSPFIPESDLIEGWQDKWRVR